LPSEAESLLSYYPLRKYDGVNAKKVRTISMAQVLPRAKGSNYGI
jgi:hypothetical protein